MPGTRQSLLTLSLLAASLALAVAAAPARAVTIGFDSLSSATVVTNQFAGDGILFSNALVLTAGVTLNEIDFPPNSGTNVISGLGSGPIGVSFTAPAQFVSLQLTTADVAAVSFYNSSNVLLTELQVNPNLGSHTMVGFDAGSASIARVTIASTGSKDAFFLAVDDVSARVPTQAPVPEPSAFLTMACGLGLVAGSLRRRP